MTYHLKTDSETKSFDTTAARDAFLQGHRDQSGWSSFVDITPHLLSDSASSKTILRMLSKDMAARDDVRHHESGHVCAILSGLKTGPLLRDIEDEVYEAEYASMAPENAGPGLDAFELSFDIEYCELHVREFKSESENQAYLEGIAFGVDHDIDGMSWALLDETEPAEEPGM